MHPLLEGKFHVDLFHVNLVIMPALSSMPSLGFFYIFGWGRVFLEELVSIYCDMVNHGLEGSNYYILLLFL